MEVEEGLELGDNCIQNFQLGRFHCGIYGPKFSFMAMPELFKCDFLLYIPPQMKILNMVIPILMHFKLLQFRLKLEHCKP